MRATDQTGQAKFTTKAHKDKKTEQIKKEMSLIIPLLVRNPGMSTRDFEKFLEFPEGAEVKEGVNNHTTRFLDTRVFMGLQRSSRAKERVINFTRYVKAVAGVEGQTMQALTREELRGMLYDTLTEDEWQTWHKAHVAEKLTKKRSRKAQEEGSKEIPTLDELKKYVALFLATAPHLESITFYPDETATGQPKPTKPEPVTL